MVGVIMSDLLQVSRPLKTLWLLQTLRANALMTIKTMKKQKLAFDVAI
jgi:hypothetical protein